MMWVLEGGRYPERHEGMSTKEVATGALERVFGVHLTGEEEMILLFMGSCGFFIVKECAH